MDDVIANVDGIIFDFEDFMKEKWVDNKSDEICKFFLKGQCKNENCKQRHNRDVVCTHYLRGLCAKGARCEFLHAYDLNKMPECSFFAQTGECRNGANCTFRHIDPKLKIRECIYYTHGFCQFGPNCRDKHIKKVACPLYIFGFCPDGPVCKFGHPKHEMPTPAEDPEKDRAYSREAIRCYACNQYGHIKSKCPNRPPGSQNNFPPNNNFRNNTNVLNPNNLTNVSGGGNWN